MGINILYGESRSDLTKACLEQVYPFRKDNPSNRAILLVPETSKMDMEYEFLTGNTLAFLPAGSVAYQLYTSAGDYSLAGQMPPHVSLIRQRPFRSPHHTISPAGLSGGGKIPGPGEISLAHNGVLFLDELPEFSRQSMEVLRQPIEDGSITISRVSGTLTFPCSIALVTAMNPCPCGFYGHPTKPCTCSPMAAEKYLAKISGPMLDRIDLHIEVPPVEYDELTGSSQEESSAIIRQRVCAAREIQKKRFEGRGCACNARMSPAMLHEFCTMDEAANTLLKKAFERMGLSARGYDRLLKVARTIADLAGDETIGTSHIAEAVQYRGLDRKYWR